MTLGRSRIRIRSAFSAATLPTRGSGRSIVLRAPRGSGSQPGFLQLGELPIKSEGRYASCNYFQFPGNDQKCSTVFSVCSRRVVVPQTKPGQPTERAEGSGKAVQEGKGCTGIPGTLTTQKRGFYSNVLINE